VGDALWTTDGIPLFGDSSQGVYFNSIISDGAGGAIVTGGSSKGVLAQKVDGSGSLLWGNNGAIVCPPLVGAQTDIMPVSDGSGGAIISWADVRISFPYIYAQRIDVSGGVQWATNGVAINTSNNMFPKPKIVATDSGAIILWNDYRTLPFYRIAGQRVNLEGTVQWAANGVPVATPPNNYNDGLVVTAMGDGAGGAIFSWTDGRYYTAANHNYDIYAQRIDGSGTPLWIVSGVPISSAPNMQSGSVISASNAGSTIIAWMDNRNSPNQNIYAQRVNNLGLLGGTTDVKSEGTQPAGFGLLQNYPNPFNPSTRIRFSIQGAGFTSLKIFNMLGQEVARLVNEQLKAGTYEATFDGKNLASGMYLYKLQSGSYNDVKKMLLLK
jgi:hypothetical protein